LEEKLLTISAGTKLGRYEIRSKIGAGGMGEVYLAQDTKLDRKVALKILPAEVAADGDRMSRFIQEAKAASALNHPNIITIHEIAHDTCELNKPRLHCRSFIQLQYRNNGTSKNLLIWRLSVAATQHSPNVNRWWLPIGRVTIRTIATELVRNHLRNLFGVREEQLSR
jgi:serine/threonine protein kinase